MKRGANKQERPEHLGTDKTILVPQSTLDKWLHFDRPLSPKAVAKALDIPPLSYASYIRTPWKKFTIEHLEKIAFIINKDIVEVFWAAYKRPMSEIAHDNKKVKIHQALERAGIN